MMTTGSKPVLILGAGINGCALARELLLNDVAVWLVDSRDAASGATGGSSHLIHGGLRYLEYGELGLVKESLAERTRLLRLAPQFVHPLRLWIPVSSRFGGALSAPGRFFGWNWWPWKKVEGGRGVTLIRAGLAMYDAYARDPLLPKHSGGRAGAEDAPPFNLDRFRWACSYYDAHVMFPERLVMGLLHDAHLIAHERGLDFRVLTYHQSVLYGKLVELSPVLGSGGEDGEMTVEPSMIVNATGAWVDETLQQLSVPSRRLMGGTKGSHLFTFNARLREMLAEQGIYAEAADGRPIFITPLADAVLIGTTDERFDGPPEQARLTEPERDYLLGSVNAILPDARLTPDDVDFHYSAVRPLPYVDARSTAAITRRHAIVRHEGTAVPMISLVGGKLTTMRSLAEEAAGVVLAQFGHARLGNSENRGLPGGQGYPHNPADLPGVCQAIAARVGYSPESVAAVVRLVGVPPDEAFEDHTRDRRIVTDTLLPVPFVRWVIWREQVRSLSDLVERRLMLLYHQRLTYACLHDLADLLGVLVGHANRDAAIEAEVARLRGRYGKRVE